MLSKMLFVVGLSFCYNCHCWNILIWKRHVILAKPFLHYLLLKSCNNVTQSLLCFSTSLVACSVDALSFATYDPLSYTFLNRYIHKTRVPRMT